MSLARFVLIVVVVMCYGSNDPASIIRRSLDSDDTTTLVYKVRQLEAKGLKAVYSITRDRDQPFERRRRAISLLATFENADSTNLLIQLMDDVKPTFRCIAIQTVMAHKSKRSIPALIRKLDDKDVCMQFAVTDPGREVDVYVSDEAVRALEKLTGISFEAEKDLAVIGHRAVLPWKKWWTENQKEYDQQ